MTRRARRDVAAVALVAAALVAGAPTPARAQSASDLAAARDLFAKAEKDEAKHDYAAALDALRRAGAIKMTPGIRFHIALCEENTGDIVKALADYVAAQEHARAENNQDVLDVVGDAIEQLRPRVPTVKIVVPDDVGSHARVKLDGKDVPPSGWGVVIPLEVGPHVVEASAPGRATYRASIAAKEHEATVLDVRLAPAPIAPAPAVRTATPAAPRSSDDRGESAPSGDARTRTGAVAFTVATVVLVAGGVGAFAFAGSAQSDAREACAVGACDADKTKVRTWDAVALGSWVAAAAAGTIAIVLWTRPSHAAPRAALQLAPRGAALLGHF